MKATIEVRDRKEADAIRAGLEDPMTRAMVTIIGVLLPLTPRARTRVMSYVTDKLDEDRETAALTGNGTNPA